jgi:hypothetical protein
LSARFPRRFAHAFFGFGFGSRTSTVRVVTPTGPLGPCAAIRTR